MSRRRHCLLVTNDFPPKVGGIQAYLWELFRRQDPASFTVLTASSHEDARAFDAEQARSGIRIERVPGSILYFPSVGNLRRVRRLAHEVGATLVLFDPVLPLGLLGPFLSIPYGVVLHGAEVAAPARLPVTRPMLSGVLSRAAVVISAGRFPSQVARDAVGGARPGSRTSVFLEVPPGVDCSTFVPMGEDDRRAARRRFGLSEDGLLVTSMSRLVPRKGMDVLAEAVRRLEPSFPGVHLAVAGAGRDAHRLAAQVERTATATTLLGRIAEEDKAAFLGMGDVFAMACRTRWGGLEQEGFGIVFLEAAACGVAQLAGESGGAADAVVDGVTGSVVARPGDPGSVARKLRGLLADPLGRAAMGAAARRRACEVFDYDVLAKVLAEGLAEVQG